MSSSSRTGLVELLATWELTSLPGVHGLFRVMSGFRGLDELALLGRVADSPGIALVPGLRDEVRGALKKSRERSSVEPEFRERISDLMGKTSDALETYAREQRGTLQRDLLECAARLPQDERERVFQRLWQSTGSGAGGRLDQVRAIDEARELLDQARKALGSDDAAAAGQAVQDDDPAAIAAARSGLEAAMSRGDQVVETATSAPPVARELLKTVRADARAMLQNEKLTLRTLAELTDVLDTLAQGLEDKGFASAFTAPGRSGDAGEDKQRVKAASELRRVVASSSEALTRLAKSLPTAQVVRFRARVDDAEAAAYSDDMAEMKRWVGELGKDSDEMGRLAERQRRFEDDRNAAEGERLAAEIERLEPIARGGDAKRLQGLRADIAKRKKRADVAAALPLLAARIANHERLNLAMLLERATKCPEKARVKMQPEMDRAEQALADEDLAAVGEAASGLGQVLKQTAPWRGPRGRIVAAVVFVAVLVAAVVGARAMRGGATSASFEFEMAAGVDSVEFVLVRGGEIEDKRQVSRDQRVDVSLPAGRYEVFVNGYYTGRVVRVPEDVGSIDPIWVPR